MEKLEKLHQEYKNLSLFSNTYTPYKFIYGDKYLPDLKINEWNQITERNFYRKTDRKSNLIIFGMQESNGGSIESNMNNDKNMFFEILHSIGVIGFKSEIKSILISGISRLNIISEIQRPAPLLIELAGNDSRLKRNQILKMAKKLKSTVFKGIFISADMSKQERKQMKELIQCKNEHNKLLNETKPNAEYFYGIRNRQVVKVFKNETLLNRIEFLEKRIEKAEKKDDHRSADFFKLNLEIVSLKESLEKLTIDVNQYKDQTKEITKVMQTIMSTTKEFPPLFEKVNQIMCSNDARQIKHNIFTIEILAILLKPRHMDQYNAALKKYTKSLT